MELIKTEFSDLGGLLKIIEDRIVFVGTLKYWECVRCLLSNDAVGFEKRERQGAKDLVNCLLNYGYAIMYARCCVGTACGAAQSLRQRGACPAARETDTCIRLYRTVPGAGG